MKVGYLLELCKQSDGDTDFFKVFCSRNKLAKLLQDQTYYVYSAKWENITDYQRNHPEEKIEEWDIREFDCKK